MLRREVIVVTYSNYIGYVNSMLPFAFSRTIMVEMVFNIWVIVQSDRSSSILTYSS